MPKHIVEEDTQTSLHLFDVGDSYTTKYRYITGWDLDNYAITTGNLELLFLSDKAAKSFSIPLKSRVVPGPYVFTLMMGMMESAGLLDNGMFLMHVDMDIVAPTYVGDIVTATVELLDKKDYKKDPNNIILNYSWKVQNQDGVVNLKGVNT